MGYLGFAVRLAVLDDVLLSPGSPEVSVIVLAHRNVTLLRRCLTELSHHRSTAEFEVIAVANGATPEVRRVLDEFEEIVPVVSRSNRGFAGGANLGVSRARGARLAFLNDDALVTEGWLDALMHVLDTRPSTGAVGSLVVDQRGRVLEFGSTFEGWSPASLDRGRHLDELRCAVPRDVDYVSACSLLVRREVFEQVGGFDESYYPAYFEDADLAFRIWSAGHAVSVTPASVVVHSESASTTSVIREIMFDTTGRLFRDRWADLVREPVGGLQLSEHLPRPHEPVIVIDDFVPRGEAGSGLARSRQMVEAITANGHPVLFHARQRRFEIDMALASRGVRALDDLTQLDRNLRPSLVVVSRPHNLALGEVAAELFDVPLVYDAEARFAARIETQLLLNLSADRHRALSDELEAVRELERRAAVIADAIVAISPSEARWFSLQGARDVWLVDPFPDTCEVGSAVFSERQDALFIAGWMGGADSPNGDGLRWLADEVVPRVVRRVPGFRLRVTGGLPPPDLLSRSCQNLEFIGEVSDLRPLLDRTLVTVCPIRFGAGVKVKTVDSLARGVPVVSTVVGAEGLAEHWRAGMMVADDPAVFADALVEAITSELAWSRLREPLIDACREHRGDARAAWADIFSMVHAGRSAETAHSAEGHPRFPTMMDGESR